MVFERLFFLFEDIQTIDICAITQVQLSRAYIVSPSYPANINGGVKCECEFKSNYKDGQILLRRLDMKVGLWFFPNPIIAKTELSGIFQSCLATETPNCAMKLSWIFWKTIRGRKRNAAT
jgi:hypothetical protein